MIKYLKAGLRLWWVRKIRKEYAKSVGHGRVDVCWVDVDGTVSGWHMPADEEFDLIQIAMRINHVKRQRLMEIINSKGGEKNGKQKTNETC